MMYQLYEGGGVPPMGEGAQPNWVDQMVNTKALVGQQENADSNWDTNNSNFLEAFNAALLAGASYLPASDTRLIPDGYTAVNSLVPSSMLTDSSGFSARVYQDSDGHYYVVDRGTVPNSVGNWLTDVAQGLGMKTQAYSDAINLAQFLSNTEGADNVTFVGHSLGGGLATAQALAIDANAITFNPAGLAGNTFAQINSNSQIASQDVDDYDVSGEILNNLQTSPLPFPRPDGVLYPLPALGPPTISNGQLTPGGAATNVNAIGLHGMNYVTFGLIGALVQGKGFGP